MLDCSIMTAWPNRALVGRKVRRGNSVRTIVGLYSDIPGGVRLDHKLEGFYSWNISELRLEKNK